MKSMRSHALQGWFLALVLAIGQCSAIRVSGMLMPLKDLMRGTGLIDISKSFARLSSHEHDCLQSTPIRGTMKSHNKFVTLLDLARKASMLPGDIMMAGVAQGGDVYGVLFFLACIDTLKNRQVHAFDTWEGLPASELDEDKGFIKGSYHKPFEAFLQNGKEYGKLYNAMPNKNVSWEEAMLHLKTHKGFFADTMPRIVSGKQVAFLSCDGDMYQSTIDCLSSAGKNVVPGGPIYQDDYYTFRGSYQAVVDYRQEVGLSTEAAPMYVVRQLGDATPIEEQHGRCKPPVDNSAVAGTCSGTSRSEAGFWIQPKHDALDTVTQSA